jgi:hypothetical protein
MSPLVTAINKKDIVRIIQRYFNGSFGRILSIFEKFSFVFEWQHTSLSIAKNNMGLFAAVWTETDGKHLRVFV